MHRQKPPFLSHRTVVKHTGENRMKAKEFTGLFERFSKVMEENRRYLIQLDSVVGDGDLGLTMDDGFKAAYRAVRDSEENDIGKLLYGAGKAMSVAVPSTMGTLMASGWMQAGKAFRGADEIQIDQMADIFAAYLEGVAGRGKAKPGEKTFLDGLAPAVDAMKEALENGKNAVEVAEAASEGAAQGFRNTTTMIAVHGRAATRGAASRELEDPGAAVAMLMMQAYRDWVRDTHDCLPC